MPTLDLRTLIPRSIGMLFGAVTPSELNAGAVDTLVLTGQGFTLASVASFSGAGITISAQRFISSTRLELDVSVAESAVVGGYTLTVSKDGGATVDAVFTVTVLTNPIALTDCTLWQQSLPANLVYGGCYTLTAACKQYWQLASNIDPGTSDFSFEGWVNLAAIGAYVNIICTGGMSNGVDGFYISINDVNKVTVGICDSVSASVVSTAIGTFTLSATTWYHLVVNFDRDANAEVFINGSSIGSTSIAAFQNSLGATCRLIGSRPVSYGANYFDGSLAALRYRTRLMTAGEITSSYNLGNGKTFNQLTAAEQVGVVHAWDCLDQAGASLTTLRDEVGTNHGTQTNAAIISGSTLNGNFETRTGREWLSAVVTDKAHLECASAAALNLGTGDIWITASCLLASITGVRIIACKVEDANNWWSFYCNNSTLTFEAKAGGATKINMICADFNSIVAPYHVAVLVDRSNIANNKIYVNGVSQTLTTNTVSEDSIDNAGKLYLGGDGLGATQYFNGYISQVGIGKPADASAAAVVTAASVTNYNAGLGQYYGEIAAGDRTTLGITAYWDLTDGPYTSTRTANDFVSTNDLTFAAGELVTNGTFTTDASWTKGTGWRVDDSDSNVADIAIAPGAESNLYQDAGITIGRSYATSFDIVSISSGNVKVIVGNAGSGTPRSSIGTYTQTITAAGGTANVYLQAYTTFVGSIDNVSLTAASIPCVSDADVFGSWLEFTSPALQCHIETAAPYAGACALRLDCVATNSYAYARQLVLTSGKDYSVSVYAKADGAATLRIETDSESASKTLTTSWAEYTTTGLTASSTSFYIGSFATSRTVLIDNVVLTCTSPIPNGNGPATYTTPADGDPVSGWNSSDAGAYSFAQATLPSRPVYEATGVHGLPSLDFDGSDDYIRSTAVAGLLTATKGTINLGVRPGAIGAEMTLLSAADEAAANEYIHIGITAGGRVFVEVNDSGTVDRVAGSTTLVAGTDYTIQVTSIDTAWSLYVNGELQSLTVSAPATNSGKWFGDLAGLDALVLGALVLSTGTVKYYDGLIAEDDLFSVNLSAANAARVRRYYETRYGT